MRKTAALFLRSFFKGVIILAPFAITIYIIFWVFFKIDTLIPIEDFPRGLGFLLIISSVTIIGYLGTRFFIGKAIFDFLDHILEHTPGIKYIYSSVKDVMSSFVGDKKRFNQPVWVRVNDQPEILRIGFVTQRDMSYLGLEGKVAVYLPHSYAISGWVIVVASSNIQAITNMSSAEAMKFAVSGGITISDESGSNGAKKPDE